MRLIDRDALLKSAHYIETGDLNGYSILYPHDVLDAPTVDAVPVIRCKDCRFCRKYKYREGVCTCLKFSSGRNMYDYCSYAQLAEIDFGERRNDD